MNNLSDLELCKKIAEIEGYESDHIDITIGVIWVLDGHAATEYNPLTDRALLWDLRLKYKVEIDDECTTCRIWDYEGKSDSGCNWVVDYETDDELPRAMLEVIVGANNG